MDTGERRRSTDPAVVAAGTREILLQEIRVRYQLLNALARHSPDRARLIAEIAERSRAFLTLPSETMVTVLIALDQCQGGPE